MAKFKILKTGETNIDSTDIWRFVLHSDYPVLKIFAVGSYELTINAGSDGTYYDVVHNLGYEPIYFSNILWGTNSYQVPSDMYSGIDVDNDVGGISSIRFYSALHDPNTIRIGAYTADGEGVLNSHTFTVYWIITLDEY